MSGRPRFLTRMERQAKWEAYIEAQFLAALLAFGEKPVYMDTPQGEWTKYHDGVVDFLYPRMNYMPCKSPSQEVSRKRFRRNQLWYMYCGWYKEKERE